jgi:hypothetical protein
MLATAQLLNLAVRFAVEVALLGAVAVAAWNAPVPTDLRWLTSVAAVVVVAAGWVLLVHGDGVPELVSAAAQVAALALGVGSLLWLGASSAAAALTAIALVNAALLAAWNQ